jgi:hypothetical protein
MVFSAKLVDSKKRQVLTQGLFIPWFHRLTNSVRWVRLYLVPFVFDGKTNETMERKFLRYRDYWLDRTSSYWKDKVGTRALVDSLLSDLDSESSR